MGKPLLFISDGTVGGEINLLDPKAITVNGWRPKMPGLKGGGIYSNSALADGHELVIESYDDVVEDMPLYINGKDPDQIGAAQHNLFDLMRTLRGYFTRNERESTPVYLGFRPKDQTNIQYALLKNYGLDTTTEGFGHEIKGSIFKPAVMAGTLNLEREHGWRDNPPGVLPTAITVDQPQAPSARTYMFVPNYRSSFALTHIFNFDDSLAAWSGNLIASTNYAFFSVAGSVPAVQDIVYFISTQGPFFNVLLNLSIAGNVNASFVFEYWNGAAWVTATVEIYSAFKNSTTNFAVPYPTGPMAIQWQGAANWARTVVNGVNGYALRCRITAVTAWTTNFTQGAEVVWNARDNYIELDSNDLKGDIPALIKMVLEHTGIDSNLYSNMILVGAKSRGLANFISRINLGSPDNPAYWSQFYGADTVTTGDGSNAGSMAAVTSFAGTLGNVSRVQVRYDPPGDEAIDFAGLYDIILICEQRGGSAGDVQVQLQMYFGSGAGRVAGVPIRLTRVTTGKEMVNLGRFRIPPTGNYRNASAGPNIIDFFIFAQAVSNASDLYSYQLILHPVDELSMMLRSQIVDVTDSRVNAFARASRAELDGGVLIPEATIKLDRNLNSVFPEQWTYIGPMEQRSESPSLMPGRQTRLYFLFGYYPIAFTAGGLLFGCGDGGYSTWYAHNRWLGLRGDE